jgi:MYXO-CTERM domain-containing protein
MINDLADFIRDLGADAIRDMIENAMGNIFECNNPGPPCHDYFYEDVQSFFKQIYDENLTIENEHVFDSFYEAVQTNILDEGVSPASVAYALVNMMYENSPGSEINEHGLVDFAVAWSLQKQGINTYDSKAESIEQSAILDFVTPPEKFRPRSMDTSDSALPAVGCLDLGNYQGFREATSEELESYPLFLKYLEDRRAHLKQYKHNRRIRLKQDTIEQLLRILDTHVEGNLMASIKIAKLKDDLLTYRNYVGFEDGKECISPSDCLSGFCVDGTCCDTACEGICETCQMAATWGTCVPVADGTSCADEDLCNGEEKCQAGQCVEGQPVDCDDGDICNGEETCQAGQCIDGTTLDCDDGNPDTEDSCTAAQGCVNEEIVSPDGMSSGGGCGCSTTSGGNAVSVLLLALLALVFRTRKGTDII